ncbi:MAG: two-component system, chemotaxis family, chemotaxis protein CheY [Blastocatellia bacterium]|jgi:CheY-like chemotaxis protein/tetratricopeptide (TPR) repeat protein|nr:two-component system, chemotaxis family, chemotaxis protein CheY [Blastocatellia bacterium]
MHLAKEFLAEIDNQNLSVNERALLRCRLAKHQEWSGDFEAAREALGELWQGAGFRPNVEGLDKESKAEVLMRAGALTGWVGSEDQIEGSQELAKDLMSESIRFFEELGNRSKVGEARSLLAVCYWRAGAFDEARVTLQEALGELDEVDIEQRAIALHRTALVETSSNRLSEALRIYNEAAPLFDRITDHSLGAHFHDGLANVLNQLSSAEHRMDYADRALVEYAAASFHFEQAGHERYQACVENNLGFLFGTLGKFDDAHEHLDRAQMLMTRLKDNIHLAQVDETRSRILLAEGRTVEAEKTSRAAVRRLEKGDELSLLSEALMTHGVALARLAHTEQARAALKRAAQVAEQAGDFESAGLAALTLVEQLGVNLSDEEIGTAIERTGVLLDGTHDTRTLRRLVKVFRVIFAVPAPVDWTGFSFKSEVRRYEAHLIRLALNETNGLVTRAARLLGFRHHQSLITLIASRHKELIETGARAPVRSRRRHLIVHPKRVKKKKVRAEHAQTSARISILHVEDNQQIAKLVNDMVVSEEWRMELCADGYTALDRLTGKGHYDLLLVDNDIPGLSGVELVKRARKITDRRRTPIVMLSGSDCESEAWGAGVNAFLKKPEQIGELSSTIARLLKIERG